MRSNLIDLLIVFLCVLNITCRKSPENPNRPKPVKFDFNIRFKVAGQAYEYKLDEDYAFNQWTKTSPGQSGTYLLNPAFRVLPNNPLNMNVYTLGFNFPSYNSGSNSIDWVKAGILGAPW